MTEHLLIVGNPENWHVGGFFSKAAQTLDVEHSLADVREAYQGSYLCTRIWWHLGGHRPFRLTRFSRKVLHIVKANRPAVLLAAGICPLDARVLREIEKLAVRTAIFLTDDPFSRYHRGGWFLSALRYYAIVFTPRRSNMEDLRTLGCQDVRWLPFAHSPELHYLQPLETQDDHQRFSCDVALIATADKPRSDLARALIRSGLDLKAYGNFWNRYLPGQGHRCGGMVFGSDFRKAVSGAKVHVCPVRHSNRDGHVMRTFELPACGACIIMEDTAEHRKLFGNEGEVVLYYRNEEEAAVKANRLINAPTELERLKHAALRWINSGAHTYRERLISILRA